MGWKAKGSIPGRRKVLIFPLPRNKQNISWVSPSLIINGYSGFIPLDQGAEAWIWTPTFVQHKWVELYLYSHNMPFWHAQREFYLYDVPKITLPIACRENLLLKKKIIFLWLVLCQEPFLWDIILHLCVSICIYSCINTHRKTMLCKISLIVTLEKTAKNPIHTHTLYIQASLLTYLICSYHQTLHFLCWRLSSALNSVDLVGLSDVVENLMLGCSVG